VKQILRPRGSGDFAADESEPVDLLLWLEPYSAELRILSILAQVARTESRPAAEAAREARGRAEAGERALDRLLRATERERSFLLARAGQLEAISTDGEEFLHGLRALRGGAESFASAAARLNQNSLQAAVDLRRDLAHGGVDEASSPEALLRASQRIWEDASALAGALNALLEELGALDDELCREALEARLHFEKWENFQASLGEALAPMRALRLLTERLNDTMERASRRGAEVPGLVAALTAQRDGLILGTTLPQLGGSRLALIAFVAESSRRLEGVARTLGESATDTVPADLPLRQEELRDRALAARTRFEEVQFGPGAPADLAGRLRRAWLRALTLREGLTGLLRGAGDLGHHALVAEIAGYDSPSATLSEARAEFERHCREIAERFTHALGALAAFEARTSALPALAESVARREILRTGLESLEFESTRIAGRSFVDDSAGRELRASSDRLRLRLEALWVRTRRRPAAPEAAATENVAAKVAARSEASSAAAVDVPGGDASETAGLGDSDRGLNNFT
jgi:hypothetical protein